MISNPLTDGYKDQTDDTVESPTDTAPQTAIELPERRKELKKSKSQGFLDKLSVRKVRKERAKLKELKSDDVFSKKLNKSEMNYAEFFNGLDKEEEGEEDEASKTNSKSSKQDDSGRESGSSSYQSDPSSPKPSLSKGDTTYSSDKTKTSDYSSRKAMQNRDLPPIPPESPNNGRGFHHNDSKESLYEHLPPAPQPPSSSSRRSSPSPVPGMKSQSSYHHQGHHQDDDEEEEDGYMVPMQIQREQERRLREQRERDRRDREQREREYREIHDHYSKRSEVRLRQKPPMAHHESLSRSSRARKTRSELPPEFAQYPRDKEDCPLDIDDLFSFAYNSKQYPDSRPLSAMGAQHGSTSHLYGMAGSRVPAWTADLPSPGNYDHHFMDNLDLETRDRSSRYQSRQARNMNANPNATLRSHNIRKMQQRPSAMEVFHFSDSFSDIRKPDPHNVSHNDPIIGPPHDFQNSYEANSYDQQQSPPPQQYGGKKRPPLMNSRSMDASTMSPLLPPRDPHQQHQQNIYGTSYGMHYAESEPGFRYNHHHGGGPMLGASDFFKQGDDSAISINSRGDGGFHNESEYSYSEHNEGSVGMLEDGWTPPDDVEGMSVQEVSKSLRYIGMKDRVVLRFSNEQIDGNMLCTLDKKLLKEGFPELNALEVKKILDFVQGWRPKKR